MLNFNMLSRVSLIFLSAIMLSGTAHAECTAKKVVRNAALEANTGISGRCDTEKLIKQNTNNKRESHHKKHDAKDKKAEKEWSHHEKDRLKENRQ